MSHKTIIKVIFVLSWAARVCWASGCTEDPQAPPQEKAAVEPVDAVLERLNKTTSELKSYEAEIEYKFTQPLLQSESLNKGVLYYARSGGTAAMRVNFNTRKQEDEKEQKYVEQYIVLDGARLPTGPTAQRDMARAFGLSNRRSKVLPVGRAERPEHVGRHLRPGEQKSADARLFQNRGPEERV